MFERKSTTLFKLPLIQHDLPTIIKFSMSFKKVRDHTPIPCDHLAGVHEKKKRKKGEKVAILRTHQKSNVLVSPLYFSFITWPQP